MIDTPKSPTAASGMGKLAADAWRFTIEPGGQLIELLPSSSS